MLNLNFIPRQLHYKITVHFFPRIVSSLNSWKVVLWLDTPSENGSLRQLKVKF